jgi:3-oxo-5-alpha-steroid 4-dehydrogenase 1
MKAARWWYDLLRKWFLILPPFIAPLSYFIDAPFGRFSPANSADLPTSSILLVDGIKSWIFMELISPITFIFSFLSSPLNYLPNFYPHLSPLSVPSSQPPLFLTLFFLTHYLNRAIISPLRTPSRSKFHIVVPLAAVGFNLINGFLMGTYLSSPEARFYLRDAFGSVKFWCGVGLGVVGFVGNVVHDEILFDIRRKAAAAKASEKKTTSPQKEHYAIPHGYLYKYISYPNYLCEWLEWLGFALAAAPFPFPLNPTSAIAPPWVFLLGEVFLMAPRALKGHQWYKEKFGERYPSERKAVVPFLI